MATLHGRVAIVTGAARGIGFAIVRRLSIEGASVVVADRDEAGAREAVEGLEQEGFDALAVPADVTRADDLERLVQAAVEWRRRIDILVNNAGITGPARPSWEYGEDEWRQVLDVDLTGVFLGCRAVVPRMLAQGSGRIINIASISGKDGNPNMAAYSAAKAGVIGFTKALGKELATQRIYVNAVAPAVIETELLQQLTPAAVDYMVAKIPMGRTGRPEEVAALVAWLASDECSFSTGAVFDVSGGRATY